MTIDELITKLEAAKLKYGGAAPVLVACDDDENGLPYHKTFGANWHPTVMDGDRTDAFILLAD